MWRFRALLIYLKPEQLQKEQTDVCKSSLAYRSGDNTMVSLKRNFIKLIAMLIVVMILLALFSITLAENAQAADTREVEMPVSIIAIMVTLIDHSAHHIWDYGVMERNITSDEWRIVEYYAIQLAAAGPTITLGGTGIMDDSWVLSPLWTDYVRVMTNAAMAAMVAAQSHNQPDLLAAGNDLTDSCEGCHETFKSDLPTEGITHLPEYDFLYHMFAK
jgi:hypothetical protein